MKFSIYKFELPQDSRGVVVIQATVLFLVIAIVAATIGLAFINGKSQAKDKQRLSYVLKISEALKIYFDVNGYYPTSANGVPDEIERYLSFYPNDDVCPYFYERKSSGDDYKLAFCLGEGGMQSASSKGIQ